jgi:hypothetical protein
MRWWLATFDASDDQRDDNDDEELRPCRWNDDVTDVSSQAEEKHGTSEVAPCPVPATRFRLGATQQNMRGRHTRPPNLLSLDQAPAHQLMSGLG